LTVAYVLAKVEAGLDEEVIREVRKIAGVRQATPTYGLYDLHVEVSCDTMEELDKFIFDGIRRIHGIKETATLIAFKVI
jgi:DNA-binding Lrp family transcriptional regulator